jgi:paraquat-inducible protein A
VQTERTGEDEPKAVIQACRECDTTFTQVELGRNEVARCRNCHAVVARHPLADVDKALAIAIACAILFFIANLSPVLVAQVAGTRTEANIWQSISSMDDGWMSLSAAALLVTMLLVPFLQFTLVIWLLSFARFQRRAPGFPQVLAVLHDLRPWSMTEVFLLGSLVVIVKLSNFVPISAGPGVWALGALTILLAILGRFDPSSWWTLEPRVRS